MRKTSLLFVASAVAFSAFASSKDAHALGPLSLEAGIGGGVGTNPGDGQNPLGVGLAARAGVSIFSVYGGVMGEYFLGGTDNSTTPSVSFHTLRYGIQAGYNFGIPFITIRPQVGFGNLTITGSSGGASQDYSSVWIEPGVVGIISLGMYFIGADINALLIPSYPTPSCDPTTLVCNSATSFKTAMTVHGQVGITF
jgi:hypothetical protein